MFSEVLTFYFSGIVRGIFLSSSKKEYQIAASGYVYVFKQIESTAFFYTKKNLVSWQLQRGVSLKRVIKGASFKYNIAQENRIVRTEHYVT